MSGDRTVVVRLKADVSDLVGKMALAGKSIQDLSGSTLSRVSKDLNSFGTNAGKSIDSMGSRILASGAKNKKSFQEVGAAAAVSGGLILAGLGAAVVAAAQFDKAMSSVRANVDDKSAPSMKRLSDAALQAGQTTVFSATEAAEAENELAKAGLTAAQITGGALTAALNLASAGQIGLGEAAEITSSTMVQFGLNASDAGHIADTLAAAADKSLGGVTDLGEALKYAGPQAHAMGMSLDQTVGVLADFASAGILGSQAGTGLRQIMVSLAAPTQQAQDTMKQYGITVFDAQGKFIGMAGVAQQLHDKLGGLTQQQQQAALANIFTARSVSEVTILMQQGAAGVDKWTQAVHDQGFAAEQAATKLDNLSGDTMKLKNSFQVALIETGQQVQGALRGTTQEVTHLLQAYDRLGPAGKTVVVTSGAIVGGIALTGGMALFAIPKIAALRSALVDLGVEQERVNKAMSFAAKGGLYAGGFLLIAGSAHELVEKLATLAPSADKVQVALAKMIESGQQSSTISQNFNVDKLVDGANKLGDQSLWGKISNGFGQVEQRAYGTSLVLDTFSRSTAATQEQFKALDTALAQTVQSGNLQAAQAEFGMLTKGMDPSQVKAFMAQLPGFSAAIDQAATAAKTGGQATSGYGSSAAQAATRVDQLTNAVNDLTGVFNQRSAARQAAADIDALTASVKANGLSMDINTAKGRANQAAMDQAAQDAGKLRQSMLDAGMGTDAANAAYNRQIAALRKVMLQSGYTQAQVNRLLSTVVATGAAKADPLVTQHGAEPAQSEVVSLHNQINALRDRIVNIKNGPQNLYTKTMIAAIQAEINGLHDKVINITTHQMVYTSEAKHNQSDPRDPNTGKGSRWGNVFSYATGGTTTGTVAKIAPAKTLLQWAEPATGGEAFIPRRGNQMRSRSIVEQAAAWYGGEVSWAGGRSGVAYQPPVMPAAGQGRMHPEDLRALLNTAPAVFHFEKTDMTPRTLNHALDLRARSQRTGRPR